MTDAARFEAFVREYQDMVFATAVRLLGREADAEDVAQTVFMRAFERFTEIGGSPSAAGWLKTVTTNLCLNHLSRYRARWQFFGDVDDRGGGPALSARLALLATAPEELERVERQERLERALRRLPDHQRVPLALRYFEEMSYQEIAETLRVSVAKVKSDIHRGREALKKELSIPHGSG
ncbi:MAG TPA: sigma-70 family RNA polymerase sigma factor [Vicinamibacterales bacterium]|nr:sigma-70 family RNA polymerase sigma factor [Vicinamibacterales bacterium]